jgi:hypothetical protein
MAGNASNQRIIPLEEGWNDEIKAKVRSQDPRVSLGSVSGLGFSVGDSSYLYRADTLYELSCRSFGFEKICIDAQ